MNSDIISLLDECRRTKHELQESLELKDKQFDALKQSLSPKTHFGFLFSKNHEMQKTFLLAEKYKDFSFPIVILGEKGCGKEAMARAVHLKSNRRGSFIVYSPSLALEDILTQSDATLYFQDISLITPDKQNALLTCLDNPESRARLMISTSQLTELEPVVQQKLKPLVLNIVPLRDRKEDILHLISTFVQEFSQNSKNINHFSSTALGKLLEYEWPGNVSELKLEIKRILMDYPTHSFYTLSHLSEKIIGTSLKELCMIIQQKEKLPKAIEILERKLVLESLMKHSWNKSKVSRELGISRSGLIQKVEKYHLDRIYFPTFSTTKRRMSSRNSSFISMN